MLHYCKYNHYGRGTSRKTQPAICSGNKSISIRNEVALRSHTSYIDDPHFTIGLAGTGSPVSRPPKSTTLSTPPKLAPASVHQTNTSGNTLTYFLAFNIWLSFIKMPSFVRILLNSLKSNSKGSSLLKSYKALRIQNILILISPAPLAVN